MKRLIVRYKVKEDRAEENIDYIHKVFAALESSRPEGLRYASFRLQDGLTFVHIASIETGDDSNPLQALPAFQAFIKDIADRCDEPPQAQGAATVGSYRLFD